MEKLFSQTAYFVTKKKTFVDKIHVVVICESSPAKFPAIQPNNTILDDAATQSVFILSEIYNWVSMVGFFIIDKNDHANASASNDCSPHW